MATSIEEAIAEAIVEIKLKDWVIDAVQDASVSEEKPCNYVRKRLHVLHQTSSGGYTYSGKEIYINKGDFTYLWLYGGGSMEAISTPFKDLLESKRVAVKTYYGFDTVDIVEINELDENGFVKGYKPTTGDNADTYLLKVWKIDDTTVGHKVIEIITIS